MLIGPFQNHLFRMTESTKIEFCQNLQNAKIYFKPDINEMLNAYKYTHYKQPKILSISIMSQSLDTVMV